MGLKSRGCEDGLGMKEWEERAGKRGLGRRVWDYEVEKVEVVKMVLGRGNGRRLEKEG
jgi:hypothetical protein